MLSGIVKSQHLIINNTNCEIIPLMLRRYFYPLTNSELIFPAMPALGNHYAIVFHETNFLIMLFSICNSGTLDLGPCSH